MAGLCVPPTNRGVQLAAACGLLPAHRWGVQLAAELALSSILWRHQLLDNVSPTSSLVDRHPQCSRSQHPLPADMAQVGS